MCVGMEASQRFLLCHAGDWGQGLPHVRQVPMTELHPQLLALETRSSYVALIGLKLKILLSIEVTVVCDHVLLERLKFHLSYDLWSFCWVKHLKEVKPEPHWYFCALVFITALFTKPWNPSECLSRHEWVQNVLYLNNSGLLENRMPLLTTWIRWKMLCYMK